MFEVFDWKLTGKPTQYRINLDEFKANSSLANEFYLFKDTVNDFPMQIIDGSLFNGESSYAALCLQEYLFSNLKLGERAIFGEVIEYTEGCFYVKLFNAIDETILEQFLDYREKASDKIKLDISVELMYAQKVLRLPYTQQFNGGGLSIVNAICPLFEVNGFRQRALILDVRVKYLPTKNRLKELRIDMQKYIEHINLKLFHAYYLSDIDNLMANALINSSLFVCPIAGEREHFKLKSVINALELYRNNPSNLHKRAFEAIRMFFVLYSSWVKMYQKPSGAMKVKNVFKAIAESTGYSNSVQDILLDYRVLEACMSNIGLVPYRGTKYERALIERMQAKETPPNLFVQ